MTKLGELLHGDIVLTSLVVLKLKDLFIEMIRTPYRYIVPEQELTRLTLMTSTAAENIRRRSTIGGSRPLESVNGVPIQGPSGLTLEENSQDTCDQPLLSPLAEGESLGHLSLIPSSQGAHELYESAPLLGTSRVEENAPGDNSSEATLVSTPSVDGSVLVDGAPRVEQHSVLSNKENLPPHRSHVSAKGSANATENVPPLVDPPLSMNNELGDTEVHSADHETSRSAKTENVSPEQPSRPPPIPPRPLPAAQQNHTLEEYARQQDVTEVLNHVLFQLSCAIRPLGFDEEGEQIDQIKHLFYGRTKQHIMSDDKEEAKNDTFCSIIVRLFSLPYDIYAALDGYFDVDFGDVYL